MSRTSALDALFEVNTRPVSLVLEILDRLKEWSPEELSAIPELTTRFVNGEQDLLLESPLLDIAAAAHTIWQDGYNAAELKSAVPQIRRYPPRRA